MGSNEIKSVPNHIGNLKSLTVLNLGNNKVTSISNSIGKLSKLSELDLSFNQIDKLPLSINRLKNLEKLRIPENDLKEIDSLSNLNKLYELDLRENQFKNFPETITGLKNLEHLDLSENQIELIPDSIRNLINLYYLDLSSNQIPFVPKPIGELTNLETLSLSKNQILFLPESMLDLENLESISLDGNQLPLERLELNQFKNARDLLEYYFEKTKQKESVYDYRVLVLGESQVGKTRLVERLIHEDYHDGPRTDGLETRTWTIQLDNKKTNVRLNLWDFGGQEVYHSTHKFFLSENSLYIFVWNANEGEKENDFEYWLNTIESYGGDSPILFVISQIDTKVMELNNKELLERFPQIQGFFKVSSKTGEGIQELKEAIHKIVFESRTHWENAKWEKNWLLIKDELATFPKYKISYEDEYLPLCQKYNVLEEEAKSLIEFLHYSGYVLYFSDTKIHNLKNAIILKREQITEPIYSILDVEKIKKQKGIVHKEDFYSIIKEDNNADEFLVDLVIDIMCEFHLCFELEEGKYLVPRLLPKESIEYDWNSSDNLQIEYHYNFLPSGLVEKLIVQLKDNILKLKSGHYVCWRGGIYLQRQESFAYIASKRYERKIVVKTSGEDAKEKQEFLTILRNELDKICKSYKKLKIITKVPCNCIPNCEHRFLYSFLRGLERNKIIYTHCGITFKKVNVTKLLNGIESQKKRRRENKIFIKEQTIIDKQINNTQINIYNFFGSFSSIKNDPSFSPEKRAENLYKEVDEFEEKIKDTNHYAKVIKEQHRLSFFRNLNRKSQTYLISAEFLYDKLQEISGADYSPTILQYNRAIENELKLELFISFHNYFKNQFSKFGLLLEKDKYKDLENKMFIRFLSSKVGNIVSLGFMVTVLNNAIKLKNSELLTIFYDFLQNKIALNIFYSDVLKKLQIALNYRNESAHPGTIYKQKDAEICQSLTLDILEILLKTYKRNKQKYR